MKILKSWLDQWVKTDASAEVIADCLTAAGVETNSHPIAAVPETIICGEIVSCRPHPDAKKLQLCEVNTGSSEMHSIICGAPNARQGIKVAVALLGTQLGDLKIEAREIRGVPSAGMLCSAQEMGLGTDSDGILELDDEAIVGTPINQLLQLPDSILEVEVTPNRGDCLSVKGVARELAALTEATMKQPSEGVRAQQHNEVFSVAIEAKNGATDYVGCVVRDIDSGKKTPAFIARRLETAGIRCLHPAVDITQYVMLGLGQPMHAFDLDKIKAPINVRWAQKNESIVLLDGTDLSLTTDMLVVADATGPIALAGIMGGLHSAVDERTKHIYFESAHFLPEAIAGRARKAGLQTDASMRFERGVDPSLPGEALMVACQLAVELLNGSAGPVEGVTHTLERKVITLRRRHLDRLLGFKVDDARVSDALSALGGVVKPNDSGWSVIAPSHRFDWAIEEDLVEEVVRSVGYDVVPVNKRQSVWLTRFAEANTDAQINHYLITSGFSQAINLSFVDPEVAETFGFKDLVLLDNPLSEDARAMRPSLWPGLVLAAQRNINRQQQQLRLFELGGLFMPSDAGQAESEAVAGLVVGLAQDKTWLSQKRKFDFFDLKGTIEGLSKLLSIDLEFTAEQHPALHPGQSARIRCADGTHCGWLGAMHPRLARSYDLPAESFLFELEKSSLHNELDVRYQPISRFPQVRRDISFTIDNSYSWNAIAKHIQDNASNILININIFDLYSGEKIETGRKNIALGLIFQDNQRTLTDNEVNQAVAEVTSKLKQEFNIDLRD